MKRILCLCGLLALLSACGGGKEESTGTSLYDKELVGQTWTFRTSSGVYLFKFEKRRVVVDIGRLGMRFDLAGASDKERVIALRHGEKYLPVWWRWSEDGMLRMSLIDGQTLYSTATNALQAPSPAEWIGLRRE